MDNVQRAKAHALFRISHGPGFREVEEMLDKLVELAINEAFTADDDAQATRLLYQARGARQLVQRFKSEIGLVSVEENV